MTARRTLRLAAVLVGAVLALGAWLSLGPTQLGGSASYAVIVGSSMEPKLHRGDLAVVKHRDSYRVGEVVLYDDPQLNARVLHRIVAVEDGHFTMKGDNNDYVDGMRPTQQQVVGALAYDLGGVGSAITWVREPLHLALLVGLVALLSIGGVAGAGAATRQVRRGGPSTRRVPDNLLAASVAVGLLCGLLAVVAWSRPSSHAETTPGAWSQQGTFAYSAPVVRSAVYPGGRVRSGEPVFLKLVDSLRIGFHYGFASRQSHDVGGTIALTAVLADGHGWQRGFVLARPHPFSGDSASVDGVLDLRALEALTADVERLTGTDVTTYSLRVRPVVNLRGHAGAGEVAETFSPELPFLLDPIRLSPDADSGDLAALLAPTATGSGERRAASTISAGPLHLDVGRARILAILGLLLALGGIAAARAGRGPEPVEEHERIAARHGHLLVPATLPAVYEPGRVTDVAEFESLARLAEASARPIVHTALHGDHEYVLTDGASIYRYRIGGQPMPEAWLARETARAGR